MSIINNWQTLIKPSKLKLTNDENSQYKATLVAEPLISGMVRKVEHLIKTEEQ